jgi:hypothetical protein
MLLFIAIRRVPPVRVLVLLAGTLSTALLTTTLMAALLLVGLALVLPLARVALILPLARVALVLCHLLILHVLSPNGKPSRSAMRSSKGTSYF